MSRTAFQRVNTHPMPFAVSCLAFSPCGELSIAARRVSLGSSAGQHPPYALGNLLRGGARLAVDGFGAMDATDAMVRRFRTIIASVGRGCRWPGAVGIATLRREVR